MSKQSSLWIILLISVAGLLFSGYLSYGELTLKGCPLDGSCQSIAGVPVCVFGFIMYMAVFILSILGIKAKS